VHVRRKSGILVDQNNFARVGVVTKEQAVQIALDHLTDGLRHRLRVSAGWPGERQDQRLLQDIPAALRNRDAPRWEARQPAPAVLEAPRRRVWRVLVPGDGRHVGSDHYLIIDQETGKVIRDMEWGE